MFDPDRLLENSVDRPSTSGVLELARKAQDGDPTALGQLFQHFEEPLRRMVRIRLGAQLRAGGGIESLDVVQLTFVKAWSKLDGFEIRSEREVLAWLARIAERQIYDELDKMNAAKRGYGRNVSIEELLDASIRIDPPATDT
ncbi:MAG: ECF-type sigma factor, partial [Planctomycetota bacterium]